MDKDNKQEKKARVVHGIDDSTLDMEWEEFVKKVKESLSKKKKKDE